jgi:hypothetical protein
MREGGNQEDSATNVVTFIWCAKWPNQTRAPLHEEVAGWLSVLLLYNQLLLSITLRLSMSHMNCRRDVRLPCLTLLRRLRRVRCIRHKVHPQRQYNFKMCKTAVITLQWQDLWHRFTVKCLGFPEHYYGAFDRADYW